MPYASLVEWSNGSLRDASKGLIADPDATAEKFISWAIVQLQSIRETANIALSARGNSNDPDSRIDYAMIGAPRRRRRPPPQAAAAAARTTPRQQHGPQPAIQPSVLQRNKRPLNFHSRVPNLKAMTNTQDASAFIA